MIVKVTLDPASGADLDNFSLTADVGVVDPTTATRTQLLAGFDVSLDSAATTVTVASTGACTNDTTATISGIPATTSTTTTTAAPTTTTTTTAATTTTTTAAPVMIGVKYALVGLDEANKALTCDGTDYTVELFGDTGNLTPTFCDPDELLGVDLTPILASNTISQGSSFYLSSGGQVRSFIRASTGNTNLAFRVAETCEACPATTTTTTAAPIQIAAIFLLAAGTDCLTGNPADSFSNILWVSEDWDGFTLKAGQKVVDNGFAFSGAPTTYYSPLDPNVQISAQSITNSISAFVNPTAASDAFLVQNGSLNNVGGDNISVSTDNSGPEASFNVCF